MRPRRCPNPGQLYEITTRTTDKQLLLRPGARVNEIILGVIGRAQQLNGARLHAFVFMSTHYHLLVSVDDAAQMSGLLRMINGNLTVKLNDYNERSGGSWQRRFAAIPVAADEETQVSRLRYFLSHGVKENLVERPGEWPGASSLPWLERGTPLTGTWTSFTERYHATRRKGYVPTPGEFDTVYELSMTALPCWKHLPEDDWRRRVREMVEEIERMSADERAERNVDVLGVSAVLAAKPTARLARQRRSRAPSVHAVDPAVRRLLRAELRALREDYDEASAQWRSGRWDAAFPAGMFRPFGGFVQHVTEEGHPHTGSGGEPSGSTPAPVSQSLARCVRS